MTVSEYADALKVLLKTSKENIAEKEAANLLATGSCPFMWIYGSDGSMSSAPAGFAFRAGKSFTFKWTNSGAVSLVGPVLNLPAGTGSYTVTPSVTTRVSFTFRYANGTTKNCMSVLEVTDALAGEEVGTITTKGWKSNKLPKSIKGTADNIDKFTRYDLEVHNEDGERIGKGSVKLSLKKETWTGKLVWPRFGVESGTYTVVLLGSDDQVLDEEEYTFHKNKY